MNEKPEISKLPSRIKYYLFEWKDFYIDDFLHKYGNVRLADLNKEQLKALFIFITNKDIKNGFN